MPYASAKQRRFMQAVEHSPAFAKKAGVPQSVGQEYASKEKALHKQKAMAGLLRKQRR